MAPQAGRTTCFPWSDNDVLSASHQFEICLGDTLTNEWDMLRELNPDKKRHFDAIVANPWLMNAPFGVFVGATEESLCFRLRRRIYRGGKVSVWFRRRVDGDRAFVFCSGDGLMLVVDFGLATSKS